MKKNRILAAALAMLLCVLLVTATGCNEMANMMMQQYAQPQETLAEGESIYNLSMYDRLPSDNADIDPLFWEVEGEKGNKVYFFGSIHVADETAYRLPEHIMNAYLESDSLAVEVDINAMQSDLMGQLKLAQYMTYADGSSIADHIDPELYAAMREFAENEMSSMLSSLGYSNIDMLDMMKPSVWMSLFENYYAEAANLKSDLGIDSHFLTIAAAQGREIIELESAEFQYAMLDGFSDKFYEMQLSSYVMGDVDETVKVYRDMFEGWKEGNPEAMLSEEVDFSGEDLTDEEIEEYTQILEDYNTAMLYDRNEGMADKAEDFINSGKNVFYVVGCGHFVGKDSVIDLLLDRGYDVKQIGGMDAEPYLDMYELPASGAGKQDPADDEEEEEEEEDNHGGTTALTHDDLYSVYNYDLYVEMYEHFGGTTADEDALEGKTTKKTKKTSTTTKTTANDNGGWGGWGSSDQD
ncbi:MAG: TraB/GumN family protein [Ruminococcaceae bacterium]|nr:TraB/GumN family protein [Oscillospiraceae bacterium]